MSRGHLFSAQAKEYAAFRPKYPPALYDLIFRRVTRLEHAWDCATGNGQVASELARRFATVDATDVSPNQISHAAPAPNIRYQVCAAEQTPFDEEHFDLITVGQALHWFNQEEFYNEVRRVGRKGGCIAVWGYSLIRFPGNEPLTALVNTFYDQEAGPYWDPARRHIESEYKDLPLSFSQPEKHSISMDFSWTRNHLEGFLNSWSAVQGFIRERHYNPVPEFMKVANWPADEEKAVSFPLFLQTAIL
jgi:ubiquinone/menaquinone biosynthesis C-methylase UbiE